MANSETKILLTIGDHSVTASLAENEATRELLSLLDKSPINVRMNDYGGFEKVGELPQALPTSNSQIKTEPGDIMLYQGKNLVIFYGSNSWSYTRIGKIDCANSDEIREFLGSGTIEMQISQWVQTGNNEAFLSPESGNAAYDLSGKRINGTLRNPGIYVINGKKTFMRR